MARGVRVNAHAEKVRIEFAPEAGMDSTRTSRWAPLPIVLAAVLVVAAWAAPARAQTELRIDLEEFEDSGVSGTATLRAVEGGTFVSMQLEGDRLTGDHPTHIHTGTCDNFDPNPTFPLTTVLLDEVDELGVSETTVDDVSLAELTAEDFVILVHLSAEELTTYFVCGEIKVVMTTIPSSGTGAGLADPERGWLPLGLTALAGGLLAAGLFLRVRGRHA